MTARRRIRVTLMIATVLCLGLAATGGATAQVIPPEPPNVVFDPIIKVTFPPVPAADLPPVPAADFPVVPAADLPPVPAADFPPIPTATLPLVIDP